MPPNPCDYLLDKSETQRVSMPRTVFREAYAKPDLPRNVHDCWLGGALCRQSDSQSWLPEKLKLRNLKGSEPRTLPRTPDFPPHIPTAYLAVSCKVVVPQGRHRLVGFLRHSALLARDHESPCGPKEAEQFAQLRLQDSHPHRIATQRLHLWAPDSQTGTGILDGSANEGRGGIHGSVGDGSA